ncbi:MAG: hypothetical protein BroJett029_23210 [Alphaproteobacteria bacterium]|nr:MAG: hypothetical protein BroJett029_23210 [Alphaproteobacteria bacterium]
MNRKPHPRFFDGGRRNVHADQLCRLGIRAEPDKVMTRATTEVENNFSILASNWHPLYVAKILIVTPTEIGERFLGCRESVMKRNVVIGPVAPSRSIAYAGSGLW